MPPKKRKAIEELKNDESSWRIFRKNIYNEKIAD
jgi:hypothetical protein